MTNRTHTTHASSQILLVVVLVGKSNSGHVSSSPASVPPFPVMRQPDTFTLKNFELLASYWHWHIEFPLFLATFPASPSKARTPIFPPSAKKQSLMKTIVDDLPQIAQGITTYFMCSRLIVANVHKGSQVERGWWKKVIRQKLSPSKKPGATLPSFPSLFGLLPPFTYDINV